MAGFLLLEQSGEPMTQETRIGSHVDPMTQEI